MNKKNFHLDQILITPIIGMLMQFIRFVSFLLFIKIVVISEIISVNLTEIEFWKNAFVSRDHLLDSLLRTK